MSINKHGFDLDAEAILPPEIVYQGGELDFISAPKTLFLTGATGFVAAYLLRDLLEQTGADVYCLVRADDTFHAMMRIRNNLDSYGLWKNSYEHRIQPLVGDLKEPLLGLTPETFTELAASVDAIYHSGSKLSYIAPFEYLKDANVGGTVEVLRMATQGKPKPLHFVSSLGILLGYQSLEGGHEDDDLDASMCPDIGYFQSKYVAERVVRIAKSRGIPVTIHRIGLIVGDSETGASNVDDFVARMLIGCIQAGDAPDIRNLMDMTPVDFVSKAMVYLSQQPESLGDVFHLLNPNPINWSEIFDLVSEAGYPIKKYAFNEWIEAIEIHGDPLKNPLHPLLPFFHINFAKRMLGVSDRAYKALGTTLTQAALEKSEISCAPVDRHLVNTYLSHFVATKRLHAPIVTPVAHAVQIPVMVGD